MGSLCLALVVAGWHMLIEERRERTRHVADAIAAGTAYTIALKIEQQIEALREAAGFWTHHGAVRADSWQATAGMVLESVAGTRGIAWIEASDGVPPLTAGDIAIDPEWVRRSDPPSLEGPLPGGESGRYRLFLPAAGERGRAGVLVVEARAGDALGLILRDSAPGYALSLSWNGEELFRRGRAAADPDLAWWRTAAEVSLPLGATWRLALAPTEALAARELTPLPTYLLAGGVLLSLALAALAYELRCARQHARFVDALNRKLDLRVQEADEKDAELRRFNRELEQRVEQRTRDLADAVSDLETFNYSVSHDLRSPLGAILNFASILEEDHAGALDAEGREMIARVRRSADSALERLEGLLQLSRAGRAPLDFTTLDMEKLVRVAFEEAVSAEGCDHAELELRALPPACGDAGLVEVVLDNLLTNALKYSRGRVPRRVTVRAERVNGQNLYSIADNGVGFDMRFSSKLFGVFERLHPSDAFEGTGVGLAIVARIVARHGGRVWAEGKPDCGARFMFTLPTPEV